MAAELSRAMQEPTLAQFLNDLFGELGQVRGLAALAIAYRATADTPTISLYIFADLAAAATGDKAAKQSYATARSAHRRFRASLRQARAGYDTDLWVVPMPKSTASSVGVIHSFTRTLLGDAANAQSIPLPFDREAVDVAAFASLTTG